LGGFVNDGQSDTGGIRGTTSRGDFSIDDGKCRRCQDVLGSHPG
jgi:hypothetical protein